MCDSYPFVGAEPCDRGIVEPEALRSKAGAPVLSLLSLSVFPSRLSLFLRCR